MRKVCLINQPSGIGDILFVQKISRSYMDKGYEIIHPVRPEYAWIGDYIKDQKFPDVNSEFEFKKFMECAEIIERDDFVYLPMIHCNKLCVPLEGYIMDQHYRMLKMGWGDWPNYLIYERDRKKEDDLYYNVLGLKDGERYNFVNKLYQPPWMMKVFGGIVKPDGNDLRDIDMAVLDGFTLFDWSKVIENAENLYMVETSICYLVEVLEMKAKDKKLWPRNPGSKFIELKPVFNYEWDYVE